MRLAGAPTKEPSFASLIAPAFGTFYHEKVRAVLSAQGFPLIAEVKVDPWLPEGWSGTADYLLWHPSYKAFVLLDLKTQKGEGMRFVRDDGAKLEHLMQVSAYWHALATGGFPLVEGFVVMYLPKNDASDAEPIEPIIHECKVYDKDTLWAEMNWRYTHTQHYLALGAMNFINDALAPPMERVQKCYWNSKLGVFDVKLIPHWSAAYCPYDNTLCDCSEQGTTKIGAYRDGINGWQYHARKEYADITPQVSPTEKEIARRRKD